MFTNRHKKRVSVQNIFFQRKKDVQNSPKNGFRPGRICSTFELNQKELKMRNLMIALLSIGLFLGACAPKPQYRTREGKKKLKHYNKLQYGEKKKYDNYKKRK